MTEERVHFALRGVYNGCRAIRGDREAPVFGALYASSHGPEVARAETGFLFTTNEQLVTCDACIRRDL